jgi:DedD protein
VERLVKERLVGAAVLLAAAVILIPEMLSGPKRETTSPSAATSDDAPIKTYTIDLGQSAERPASRAEAVETTAAPPPESLAVPASTPVPATTTPDSGVQQNEPAREEASVPKPVAQVPAEPSSEPAITKAAPTKHESLEPSAAAAKVAPLATDRSVPTSKGWAVQLGSFSKADTAERLVQQMRTQGRNAFVMPVKSGSGSLYRVRVGPLQDRAAADALQRQLKSEIPSATVVAHP